MYSDKRVLVTGGNGFVGTRLVQALRDQGATVISPTHSECESSYSPYARPLYKHLQANRHLLPPCC